MGGVAHEEDALLMHVVVGHACCHLPLADRQDLDVAAFRGLVQQRGDDGSAALGAKVLRNGLLRREERDLEDPLASGQVVGDEDADDAGMELRFDSEGVGVRHSHCQEEARDPSPRTMK